MIAAMVRRAACVGVVLLAASGAHAQILVETVTRNLGGGNTARGFFATVDLNDPRVEIFTTVPRPPGSASDAVAQTVPAWRTATRARLAINANFFGTVSGTNLDIVGLAMHDGAVVSPPRQYLSNPFDPALIVGTDGRARIGNFGPTDLATAWDAVAGVGPSNTDTVAGTLLVTDGTNTGATARVDPLNRNPRTAVGVSQDGTKLFICVIDGRQTGWSVGMTLPELATFLIEKGVWRAINLDGGGSSSFVFVNDDGTIAQNRPSDAGNVFRAVSNHLGVAIRDGSTWFPGRTRPVRGAWLRPTTVPEIQSRIASLSAAGVQDLFLETLYHGRDTAAVGDPNFPSRFTQTVNGVNVPLDVLAETIREGQRHGMRVHAWCETGYLDFGTNPSPLLTANPGWIVDHRDPAVTITGDLANQRFVNLGNPQVRTALNNYFGSLTAKYPGLEGVQADYHFFPLAPSGRAPWSFDTWARGAYQAQFGVDPISEVNTTASTYPTRWVTWNRGNVTEALVQLRQATDARNPGTLFSAVAFSDYASAFHVSKMIDLPAWGSRRGAELFPVMAYFTGTNTGNPATDDPPILDRIGDDIDLAEGYLPNRRVLAGLANLTSSYRPSVLKQLQEARARGVEDWAWFDAPTLVNNTQMRADIRAFVDSASTTQLRADVANSAGAYGFDGMIDARDLALFDSVFTGTPIARTTANARYDQNDDFVIDARDRRRILQDFVRFRFGEDGVVDHRDIANVRAAFNPGPAPLPGILQTYDLDGDGDVDNDDLTITLGLLTTRLDADGDGQLSIDDLYAQRASPVDVDRDGDIDAADTQLLIDALRGSEPEELRPGP